jgi:CRISPR type III-B/RAMP module RAMP protein Cmr6
MDTYLKEIGALFPAGFPPDSPSLRLNKLARLDLKDNKFSPEAKRQHLLSAADAYTKSPVVRLAPLYDFPATRVHLTLGWRLILNLGGGLVENSGLNLHPFFSYPEIPGSSVKGLARHAAWCQWVELVSCNKAEADEIARRMARVFGWPSGDSDLDKEYKERFEDSAGTIAFMAAYPDKPGEVRLVLDIVNSHHKDYYSDETGSAVAMDNESPVPNFFLAAEGGDYVFTLRKTRRATDGDLDAARKWLVDAVTIHGIGGKTAAGYGWFSFDEEKQKRRQAKTEAEQRHLAEQKAEKIRLESLSPEEREAEKYLKELVGDPLSVIKGKMSTIATLQEPEQRAICMLLKTRFGKDWLADVADAAKAKGPDDKKGGKAFKRVNAVRPVAAKLGVQLP